MGKPEENIFKQIIEIIKDSEDLDPLVTLKEIKPDTRYREDLGFDSLALMAIIYELQELYPQLDETIIDQWIRIEDTIKTVLKNDQPAN